MLRGDALRGSAIEGIQDKGSSNHGDHASKNGDDCDHYCPLGGIPTTWAEFVQQAMLHPILPMDSTK